jgi:hypothetical protein
MMPIENAAQAKAALLLSCMTLQLGPPASKTTYQKSLKPSVLSFSKDQTHEMVGARCRVPFTHLYPTSYAEEKRVAHPTRSRAFSSDC